MVVRGVSVTPSEVWRALETVPDTDEAVIVSFVALIVTLLALDASIELVGAAGRRTLSLKAFVTERTVGAPAAAPAAPVARRVTVKRPGAS